MRLKTAFYFFATATVIVAASIAATFFLVSHRVDATARKSTLVRDFVRAVSHRRVILDDYVRSGLAEGVVAWQIMHDATILFLQDPRFDTAEEQAILEDMRENNELTKRLFTGIVRERETLARAARPSPRESAAVDNLLDVGDVIIDDANRLAFLANQDRRRVLDGAKLIVFGSLLGLSVLLFSGLFAVNFLVMRPLAALERGIGRVGEGDFRPERPPRTPREIAALGTALNDTFGKLQEQMTRQSAHAEELGRRERALADMNRSLAVAEEELRHSLDEKEALLREIHHRVKNNLNVVSSLLGLQAMRVDEPALKEALIESQNRVMSMALIHEKLYQSQGLARIDFPVYLRDLVLCLYHSYGVSAEQIEPVLAIGKASLDIDTAIPCSLIVNELVTNSLKHGFPPGRKGHIRIALDGPEDGGHDYALTVEDDGVGFPEGFRLDHCPTLGLKLVRTLARQLGGRVAELPRGDTGARVRITFRLKAGEGTSHG